MNGHDDRPRDDLTEGWPDEAGNEELAAFADRFRSARPVLSPEAMRRIERAVRDEMAVRLRRRRSRREFWLGTAAAVAAAVFLAVAVARHVRPAGAPRVPRPTRDSYTVHLPPAPAAEPPTGPLLSLESYRTLYME